MYNKTLFSAVVALSACLSGAASADLLSLSSPPGSVIWTATSIAVTNPGTAGPGSGVFTPFNSCGSCVTTASFNSLSGPITFATLVNGLDTDTITLTSYKFTEVDADELEIEGSGTATGTGPGNMFSVPIALFFSTQGPAGQPVSFSASITTTPLPSTLSMRFASFLGLGLLGYYS